MEQEDWDKLKRHEKIARIREKKREQEKNRPTFEKMRQDVSTWKCWRDKTPKIEDKMTANSTEKKDEPETEKKLFPIFRKLREPTELKRKLITEEKKHEITEITGNKNPEPEPEITSVKNNKKNWNPGLLQIKKIKPLLYLYSKYGL